MAMSADDAGRLLTELSARSQQDNAHARERLISLRWSGGLKPSSMMATPTSRGLRLSSNHPEVAVNLRVNLASLIRSVRGPACGAQSRRQPASLWPLCCINSSSLAGTGNPCRLAVSWLASLRSRLRTVSLRCALIVAKKFDDRLPQWHPPVSASSRPIPDSIGSSGCDATRDVAERVELLRTAAETRCEAPSGNATDAQVRQAALTLFRLYPKCSHLKGCNSVADSLGMAGQVARVPKGEPKPIGSLAPLPTPKPAPKPAPSQRRNRPGVVTSRSALVFRAGVRFRVQGDGSSPDAIRTSIFVHGPHSEWLEETRLP